MSTQPGSTAEVVEDPQVTTPQPAPAEPTPQPAPQDAEQAKPGSEAAPTAPPPKAEKPDAKPVKRSPVEEAIDRLATDAPKTEAKPAETDEPTGDEEPQATAEDKAADHQEPPGRARDELFKDWSPSELKNTKGSVKERFRELHKQVAEHQPYVELGRDWETFVEKSGLDGDLQILDQKQMAWAMKSQAAILRAVEAVSSGHQPTADDLALLGDIRKGIGMVDERLGIASTAADPTAVLAELQQFKGEIPDELQQLADTYGLLNKDEVALLAAMRAMKAGSWKPSAAKPAAPALKSAPAPAPKEERPAPRAASPAAVPLYRQQLNQRIDALGVDAAQRPAWVQTNLVPVINQVLKEAYPDQPAREVYQSLTPREQHDLHIEAMERLQSAKSALPPKPRPPAHKPLTHQGNAGAPASAGGSPVNAAIARLAIPGT